MMRPLLPSRATCAGLAGFGATAGPLVDAVHNQALLKYDILPVSIDALDAKTSLLIPPLLAITYLLLGGVLPRVSEHFVPGRAPFSTLLLPPPAVAAVAVTTTILIIKLSELLCTTSLDASASVACLAAACLAQWLALDGTFSSLALALIVAIGGPIAEVPFISLGCWHYLSPDYFPIGPDGGLNFITGPCYFAVTTDAVALGRWLEPPPQAGRKS